jgi:hypothetical protein
MSSFCDAKHLIKQKFSKNFQHGNLAKKNMMQLAKDTFI